MAQNSTGAKSASVFVAGFAANPDIITAYAISIHTMKGDSVVERALLASLTVGKMPVNEDKRRKRRGKMATFIKTLKCGKNK